MNPKPKASSPKLPWKVKLQTSLLCLLVDASRSSNGRVNRRIMNIVDFKTSPSKKPIKGVQTADIMVDRTRNLWFRLYVPTTSTSTTSLPVIVYFHGGGFVFMSADSKLYDQFCYRLASELPAVIISVNYRLAPEHRLPCQYDDGFDVLKFIDNEASEFQLPGSANLKQCFIAGDSAGGNIAHHVTHKASENNNNFSRLQLKGLIALQPFFGGEERTKTEKELVGAVFTTTERTDWMWKAFLPDGADRDHQAANVFGPKSVDITGINNFPETIIFVGGFDMLQDWQRRYYEWLKKSGKEACLVEYPNTIHGFYGFPELPESVLAIKEIKDFVYRNY
ncbi:hypothetical protein ACFE04_011718 [Oxalis oulophora]